MNKWTADGNQAKLSITADMLDHSEAALDNQAGAFFSFEPGDNDKRIILYYEGREFPSYLEPDSGAGQLSWSKALGSRLVGEFPDYVSYLKNPDQGIPELVFQESGEGQFVLKLKLPWAESLEKKQQLFDYIGIGDDTENFADAYEIEFLKEFFGELNNRGQADVFMVSGKLKRYFEKREKEAGEQDRAADKQIENLQSAGLDDILSFLMAGPYQKASDLGIMSLQQNDDHFVFQLSHELLDEISTDDRNFLEESLGRKLTAYFDRQDAPSLSDSLNAFMSDYNSYFGKDFRYSFKDVILQAIPAGIMNTGIFPSGDFKASGFAGTDTWTEVPYIRVTQKNKPGSSVNIQYILDKETGKLYLTLSLDGSDIERELRKAGREDADLLTAEALKQTAGLVRGHIAPDTFSADIETAVLNDSKLQNGILFYKVYEHAAPDDTTIEQDLTEARDLLEGLDMLDFSNLDKPQEEPEEEIEDDAIAVETDEDGTVMAESDEEAYEETDENEPFSSESINQDTDNTETSEAVAEEIEVIEIVADDQDESADDSVPCDAVNPENSTTVEVQPAENQEGVIPLSGTVEESEETAANKTAAAVQPETPERTVNPGLFQDKVDSVITEVKSGSASAGESPIRAATAGAAALAAHEKAAESGSSQSAAKGQGAAGTRKNEHKISGISREAILNAQEVLEESRHRHGAVTVPEAVPRKIYKKPLKAHDALEGITRYMRSKGFPVSEESVQNLYLSLKAVPLAGIAGTPVSDRDEFVRLFAEASGANAVSGRFQQVRLKNIANPMAMLFGAVDQRTGKIRQGLLSAFADKAAMEPEAPFFIYLKDLPVSTAQDIIGELLALADSRHKSGEHIVTDALYIPGIWNDQVNEPVLPDNLFVLLSPEATRADIEDLRTIDHLNLIQVPQMPLTTTGTRKQRPEEYAASFFAGPYLSLSDSEGNTDSLNDVIVLLEAMNGVLAKADARIGRKVMDEICLYLLYNNNENLMSQEKALDYIILQKILPRITGTGEQVETALTDLFKICAGTKSDTAVRNYAGQGGLFPLSAAKLSRMVKELDRSGKTSVLA
ncbi:MAG: MrcB family domain-containing protein [Eubacteriaceae bacterium]|jgi:5-methylcytosine-specific restriction protein B